jgi:restriction system protein
MTFPKQSDIELPLLATLQKLGGTAMPRDVYPIVAGYFPNLVDADLEQRLESYPSVRKWWNIVQWARQRLVDNGDIDGSTRGVWKITEQGVNRLAGTTKAPQPKATVAPKGIAPIASGLAECAAPPPGELTLRDLANRSRGDAKSRILFELKQLSPHAFEHFCMELLQQLGYSNVAVTKRSGDGGIDGYGDFRQGIVSIKSAFQAKRWTDTPVGRPEIDKLRGAIQGDYDHGVFITTSRFSKEAALASHKKGAISVMLLDGQAIAELMIERGIGVRREPVYLYEVAGDFFDFESAPSQDLP